MFARSAFQRPSCCSLPRRERDSRPHHLCNPQADGGSHGRRYDEIHRYSDTKPLELLGIFARREAEDNRGEHERNHDHLDRREEKLPWQREPATDQSAGRRLYETDGWSERNTRCEPECHTDKHLQPQPMFGERGQVAREMAQRARVKSFEVFQRFNDHVSVILSRKPFTDAQMRRRR